MRENAETPPWWPLMAALGVSTALPLALWFIDQGAHSILVLLPLALAVGWAQFASL